MSEHQKPIRPSGTDQKSNKKSNSDNATTISFPPHELKHRPRTPTSALRPCNLSKTGFLSLQETWEGIYENENKDVLGSVQPQPLSTYVYEEADRSLYNVKDWVTNLQSPLPSILPRCISDIVKELKPRNQRRKRRRYPIACPFCRNSKMQCSASKDGKFPCTRCKTGGRAHLCRRAGLGEKLSAKKFPPARTPKRRRA